MSQFTTLLEEVSHGPARAGRPLQWCGRDELLCSLAKVQDLTDPESVRRRREIQDEMETRTRRRASDAVKRNTELLTRHGVR